MVTFCLAVLCVFFCDLSHYDISLFYSLILKLRQSKIPPTVCRDRERY